MMMLVSYDISTGDRLGKQRLRQVAAICQDFGQRVQNSVFECLVDPADWAILRQRLMATIDPDEDSLRFYRLGQNWRGRVEHVGAKPVPDPQGPLIL